MLKRGQVTLFVILGIVIIAAIAFAFFFRAELSKTEASKGAAELSSLPPDLDALKEEISDCAKFVSEEAIYFTGQQGGYFIAPKDALPIAKYNLALGVKKGVKALVSEDGLKNEISSYIQAALPDCMDYLAYTDSGLKIFDQPPEVDMQLNDEGTNLNIEYKVTVEKDENTYNIFEPYEITLPHRVKKTYEASSKIADEIMKDNSQLILSNMVIDDMNIDIYNLADNFMVVTLKDKSNYEFQFGVAL